jgi:radical SAM superfamily enzyme YgiQ (UPF0313 family)
VNSRRSIGGRGEKRESWSHRERQIVTIRFPRRPQSIILFPAPYSSAVANLGFLTVWRRLNSIPDFACDRAFWDPQHPQRIRGLETGLPLADFPLLFISSSFELDLAAVIRTLTTCGIPPLFRERGANDPMIVAGGISLTLNPAPWAPIVDMALLGEGEDAIERWVRLYQGWMETIGDIRALHQASADLPFAYLPTMPERAVYPAVYENYRDDPASSPVVHPQGHFGDCQLIEMTRGCPRGCLFCAVCGVYPARFAISQAILAKLLEGEALKPKKIGLLGGAVGDHPQLKEIIRQGIAKGREVTLSSLRIERSDPELLDLLVQGGLKTLTVAPETGSDALRRRLGKQATNHDLLELGKDAERAGIQKLRLYFLIGMPDDELPQAIIELVKELRAAAPRRLNLDLSISAFIPKPGTPWEKAPFAEMRILNEIKATLRAGLRAIPGIRVQFEPTKQEREAALLSRGDAALGEMLIKAILAGRPLEQEMRVSGTATQKYLDFTNWDGELPWGFIGRHKS